MGKTRPPAPADLATSDGAHPHDAGPGNDPNNKPTDKETKKKP